MKLARVRLRVRRWRLAAIVVVVLALASGTWLRAPEPERDHSPTITLTPLPLEQRTLGPFAVEGAWRVDSGNFWFGGYSALLALDRTTLFAGADRGWTLRFAMPGGAEPVRERGVFHPVTRNYADKRLSDLESLTRDPTTGQIWGGFEWINAIARLDLDGKEAKAIRPAAMRNWPDNTGAEGMVRLGDGRFLVSSEAISSRTADGDLHTLLVFPGDPVSGVRPTKLTMLTPQGYRPVDMAQLPDGRVMVLMRKTHFLPLLHFTGRLAIYDPRTLSRDAPWQGRVLAKLQPPLPTDNYEGLAILPDGQGPGVTLWLISDDNRMLVLQRTLLLKLHWQPDQAAS